MMLPGKRDGTGRFVTTGVALVALVYAASLTAERAISPRVRPGPRRALDAARGGLAALTVLGLGVLALRRRTRDALAAEAKVWEILETAPAGVAIFDGAGRVTFVNRRAEALFGYPHGALIGRPLGNLVPDRLHALFEEHLARAARQPTTGWDRHWVEVVGRGRHGGEVPVEVNLGPVERSGGGVSVACIFRDISERKEAERQLRAANQALQAANNLLRGIIEGTHDPIAALDLEYRLIAFNSAFAAEFHKLFGTTVALGMSLGEALADHPAVRAEAQRLWARALGGEVFTHVLRLGGEPRDRNYYELSFSPIRDDDGRPIGASHIVRDITERVRAERALEESRALLQAVLDNSKAIIYIKDVRGRYLLVNRWFETLFHLEPAQILGRTDHELFPPEQADVFRANDQKVLETGAALEFEEEAPHEDGPHTYISIKVPLCNASGAAYAVCGISTDITSRKRAEEQFRLQTFRLQETAHAERQAHAALARSHEDLRKVQGQLEHAEKLSLIGRLIAGVAHEIRNPLSSVMSNVVVVPRDIAYLKELIHLYQEGEDTLAAHRPELSDRIRELSERIDLPYTISTLERLGNRTGDALARIRQLCQDLQDFSRPDRVELAEADLNEGARATANIITGRAKDRQVRLEVDLEPLPRVRCAPGRINQVVLNLLANAVDACPPGGSVTLRTQPAPGGVEIHVIDTGHGIEPSIRDRIFDPFFTTKPVGQGAGLGLSISHEIIRSHGGRIEVESTPGRGAHFTVWLPHSPLPNGHAQDPASAPILSSLAGDS